MPTEMIKDVGAYNMSNSDGQPKPIDIFEVFRSETAKFIRTFEFAANEGLTEYHNDPRHLQFSYERYSRTVEDFLMMTRLLRRCTPLSPAYSAELSRFEGHTARTLQNVQNCLHISDNRLLPDALEADSKMCEDMQRQAAELFLNLAKDLRALPSFSKQ